MKFDLIRPCKMCPFRTDCLEGWLGAPRAQEIVTGITVEDKHFACHETTNLDDETGEAIPHRGDQHCAGALIFAINADLNFNQLTRVAERTQQFDHRKLDMKAPVFTSPEDFVRHHAGADFEEAEPCSICNAGCLAPAGFGGAFGAVPNIVEEGLTYPCPHGCGNYVCDNCAPDCWCQQEDDYE